MSVAAPVRFLVADDHELVRKGIRTILESEPGWIVCAEAATGREALIKTLELKPDIVVLDLALPELNGVEVTRQVRHALPVAVLIVTMYHSDQVVQDAIDAGASGYVLKADAARTLKDAVHKILARGAFLSERVRDVVGVTSPVRRTGASRGKGRYLTSRERQVLQLLAEGHGNKEIAAALGISTKTAETHRARIMAKLDLHSMADLVRYTIRNHIIEP